MNKKLLLLATSFLILVIVTILLATTLLNYSNKPLPPIQLPGNVVCTADVKLCPDGSYTSRGGPKCEFAKCKDALENKVEITSIAPLKGIAGQLVSITGKNFHPTDNIVTFGDGYLWYIPSNNGNTLSFEVPEGYNMCEPKMENCPKSYSQIKSGPNKVQVTNTNGVSNILFFEVQK